MDFFEGKRVRELRRLFEGALDATLEPPSTQVRLLPPFLRATSVVEKN